MKLHAAISIAEKIVRELAPACERIEIAGSIRRARAEVNDIDLVILPKPGKLDAIKNRCKERCRVITDGRKNFICALKVGSSRCDDRTAQRAVPTIAEFQLDIFFAHGAEPDLIENKPGNFGSLLLCRTGSKEHNIKIASLAKSRDMAWKTYEGLYAGGEWRRIESGADEEYAGGKIIASETEEEIFQALGIEFVPPALREVGAPHYSTAHNAHEVTR